MKKSSLSEIEKIVVLFLAYGEKNRESGIIETKKIMQNIFGTISVDFIVIENSDEKLSSKYEDVLFIKGDNSFLDFSGWDKGIEYAFKNLKLTNKTIFLFANDTINRREYSDAPNYLDVFNYDFFNQKDVLNSVIGYLDDFPKKVKIFDVEYSEWIRSNIFLIPYSILRDLYPLTFPIKKANVFSNEEFKFWSDNNYLSDNWKAYISCWLFGEVNDKYPEYKLNWIKSKPLDTENKSYFQKKAVAILSEHYLSSRLHEKRINIINTNVFEKNINRHTLPYYKGQF